MNINFKDVISISFYFKKKPNGDEKIIKTLIETYPPDFEHEIEIL